MINFITSEMEMIGHQCGWKVASDAILYNLHNYGTNFFSWLDRELFLRPIKLEWTGILHNVVNYPNNQPRGFIHPLNELINHENFKSSLDKCKGIYTLSKHTTKFIKSSVDIEVETIYHPSNEMPLFSYEAYSRNPRILHVGQWMRNYQSYVDLKLDHISKRMIACEDWHYKRIKSAYGSEVEVVPRLLHVEYKNLFNNSIFFLDLFDVSACNVILECISSCAPLLIRRLPAAEEYLGADYPMFYENLEQARELAQDDVICKTHNYLIALDKSKFDRLNFIQSIAQSKIYNSLDPNIKRPLFRWTVGRTCDKGYEVLKHSIKGAMKSFGPERFDWVINYNKLPEDKLFHISRNILAGLPAPVSMIEQNGDDIPIPHSFDSSHDASTFHDVSSGSWWKICPPRLRIDAHELIMDNDIVMLKPNKEILQFLQGNSTLVLEDNSIHLGRYNDLFDLRNASALNSGLIGLPPLYDFGKAIHKMWFDNGKYDNLVGGDEQGLLTATLKQQQHIIIPRNKIIGLHPHKLALEAITDGLLHFNIVNHQSPNSSLDYKYRFWIEYEDIDINRLISIADGLHFYQMNLDKTHYAWDKCVNIFNRKSVWFI